MRAESGHDVLRLVYEAVGSPSYKDLHAAAERKGLELGVGTISNLLSGKTRPRRRTVLFFIEACLSHRPGARRSSLFRELPPGAGSADYWLDRWDTITGKTMRTLTDAGSDFFIVSRLSDTPAAQRLNELLRARARVSGTVVLPRNTPQEVFEQHHRASAVTVVLISQPDLAEMRPIVEVATDLVQRDPDGHILVPVLLDTVTELPPELAAADILDEGLSVVAERLLTLLASRQPPRAAGLTELAGTTFGLLTAIDDHLVGRPSPHGSTVDALLAEFGDPTFSERARRYGLQAALILQDAVNHADAVRHWSLHDDGTATVALHRFRDHLADSIAAGRFSLPPAVAEQVAATVRGELIGQRQMLNGFRSSVRSTSREFVLVRDVPPKASITPLDERSHRLTSTARRMCVLPPADDRFRGRDELLDDLPVSPILWLSGAPGTGTSAVAVHWAHQVSETFETVLYLDLLGMTPESRRSAPTAARILIDALGEPVVHQFCDDAVLYERLAAALRHTKTLLVLDNARDADHVAPIVRAGGPQATVITSRQRVQSFTEHAIRVPALDRRASIELLASRAPNAEEPLLDRIAELCDDLPLALRLVTARLGDPDLPADEIARLLAAERTRLDFLAAGDKAVRAAIVFTYNDLKLSARRTARYLSMSFGSVSDAPEMVVGHIGDDEARTSLALHRVVDANLARCTRGSTGPMRFRMTPLIRLAMNERSAKEDADTDIVDYRRRVARHLADQLLAIGDWEGGDPELEVDPTRAYAALSAAVDSGWWNTAVDIGQSLRTLYEQKCDLAGVDTTTATLVKIHLAMNDATQAVATTNSAAVGLRSSDHSRPAALRWAQESVTLARKFDVPGQKVECCLLCAAIAFQHGDEETAIIYSRLAVELSDPDPCSPEAIRPLINLGKLLIGAADPENGADALRHAVALADRVGDSGDRAAAYFNLASALGELGSRTEARSAWARSAELYAAKNEWMNAAIAKENESWLTTDRKAAEAMTEAVANFRIAGKDTRALSALCRLAALVLKNTDSPAAALRVFDEAHDLTPESPELGYEVEVRKACLLRLIRQPPPLPDGAPPPHLAESQVYQDAWDVLTHGGSGEVLRELVLEPVIEVPKGPEPWVFEGQSNYERSAELE